MTATSDRIVALDVGTVRIGIAAAHESIRIASPLTTILNDVDVISTLEKVIDEQQAVAIVIGLPRSLNGDDTSQTKYAREFAARVEVAFGLPVIFQDEALTSQKAEEELASRGKHYDKGEVDALAATYILEDYLQEKRSITDGRI